MEKLPDANPDLPRVVISQRALDKIIQGALLYPEPETGEAMIGLVIPQPGRHEPDIFIMDTIKPIENVVREWGRFVHGDDWQGDVLHWLHVNWEAFRELRRPSYGMALAAKWDAPLVHVGDWHKQPDDMVAPSGGDAETARSIIDDSETPVAHLVAPIVTMYPIVEALPAAPAEPAVPGAVPVEGPVAAPAPPKPNPMTEGDIPPRAIVKALPDKGWIVRIDFWYMSKRARRFREVTPVVWAEDRLPGLPPLSWQLAHPRRFEQEWRLLIDAGYMVNVERWDADGIPPYEVCFSIYKPGDHQVTILVTSFDYPARMPGVRIAPLMRPEEGEYLFEKLYEASQPVTLTQLPDWPWDSKRTLIELVWHIEKNLKQGRGT